MKKLEILITLALCCVLTIGCKKDNPMDDPTIQPTGNDISMFVLNEGTWSKNNASVSAIKGEDHEVINNFFASNNNRGLGDVAQDLVVYGSKMYVVVWNSNTVEVANARTGKSVKQISFSGKGPRYAAMKDGKVYVCCYDGTVARIDTTSLEIEANCTVTGMQPEGICVVGNKLCVAHGWTKNTNGDIIYDSTVSIVDIPTFTSERKLTVGMNPFKVMNYDDENVIVGYWGDFVKNPSGIDLVNVVTGERRSLKDDGTSKFDLYEGDLYMFDYSYQTMKTTFWKINVASGEKIQILKDLNLKLKSTYGINVDPENGDIYITDSQNFKSNGDVHCYSATGGYKWSEEVGMGPSTVIFL